MARSTPCIHRESISHCLPCHRLYKANKQKEYRLKAKLPSIPKPIKHKIRRHLKGKCNHGVFFSLCILCRKEFNRERYIRQWTKIGKIKVPFPYFQPILELV